MLSDEQINEIVEYDMKKKEEKEKSKKEDEDKEYEQYLRLKQKFEKGVILRKKNISSL